MGYTNYKPPAPPEKSSDKRGSVYWSLHTQKVPKQHGASTANCRICDLEPETLEHEFLDCVAICQR